MARFSTAGLLLAIIACLGVAVLAQPKGDAKAGEAIYKTECAKCHGATGTGDGPEGRKLTDKPSNWTAGGGGLKDLDDDKIFTVIAEGGRAIGRSKGMPAYPKLSDAQITNLVAYVKGLMKK
jgi:mono/diheme cytochrome c family protein